MPLLEMMGLCLSTVGQLPQQMTMIKLICREREREGGREREARTAGRGVEFCFSCWSLAAREHLPPINFG